MEIIEVPQTELAIDTKYISARLEDDYKGRSEFFEIYCQQNIPFALLAVNEGGVQKAIGRIVNEGKGFIKATDGTIREYNTQKIVAENIINGQSFYIDGTAAFFLSGNGLLEKNN
jgi:hypothetical protein